MVFCVLAEKAVHPELAVTRVETDGTILGGACGGNAEGGESVGGFGTGMPVAVVHAGADKSEVRREPLVEGGVPAVLAAVVRYDDDIGRFLPGDL